MADALDEQAGPAADDRRGHRGGQRVIHSLLHGREILRVDDDDVFIAEGVQHVLDLDRGRDLSLQRIAGAGVVLVAGHAGDVVVEHDGDDRALVVQNLGRAGHAGVEEGRVAHDAEDLFLLARRSKSLGHAHRDGEAAAHAHAGVHRAQRRGAAERIAADIAADDEVFALRHRVEEAAVRAAGTKHRRARHGLDGELFDFGLDAEEHLAQPLGVELMPMQGMPAARI